MFCRDKQCTEAGHPEAKRLKPGTKFQAQVHGKRWICERTEHGFKIISSLEGKPRPASQKVLRICEIENYQGIFSP